jgi:hypothetical protein
MPETPFVRCVVCEMTTRRKRPDFRAPADPEHYKKLSKLRWQNFVKLRRCGASKLALSRRLDPTSESV